MATQENPINAVKVYPEVTPDHLEKLKTLYAESIVLRRPTINLRKQQAQSERNKHLSVSTAKAFEYDRQVENLEKANREARTKINLIDEYLDSDWLPGTAASYKAELIANGILVAKGEVSDWED